MKFGKTKGTEGLLKLTKFGVANNVVNIWGYTAPINIVQSNRNMAICYVDDTSVRTAKTRPAGDALASSECTPVSSLAGDHSRTPLSLAKI